VRSIWVRLFYIICLIGCSVWLLGCGDTRLPAPEVTAPQVWARPAGGIFGQLPPAIVLASTKEATIYYTLDGSPPTTTSRVYSKPLTFNTSEVTLRFVAQDASGNTSPEQAERYRQVADAPQFSIQTAPPVVLKPQQQVTVQWRCETRCGRFRVTADDGGVQRDQSPGRMVDQGIAAKHQPIQTTVDAADLPMAMTRLWVYVTSEAGITGAASLPLIIDRQPPQVRAWPAGGVYAKLPHVELVTDEESTVYYTTDGSSPSRQSKTYQAAIRLNGDTNLAFQAVDQQGNASPVYTERYRVAPPAPNVHLQRFPGFRLDVQATRRLTWRSSQKGRYVLSANDQPLLRGQVERNKPVHSIIQGWSLKSPHNRLQLRVTDADGNAGSTSWRWDTAFLETFANPTTLDHEITTAAHNPQQGHITLPTGPLQTGFHETRYTSRGVARQGAYAYLANTRGGMQVVDLSIPATPRLAGHFVMYGEPKALAKYGDYIYMAADSSGVQIFDVSQPQAPVLVGHQPLAGHASALTILNQQAYVGTYDHGLYVYALTDPRRPRLIAHIPLSMRVMHLAATPTHIYAAGFNAGVAVIDITSPTAPTLLTTLKLEALDGAALGVAVHHDRLYVAATNLLVFDVQQAAQPRQLARLALPSAHGLAISNGRLYVADQYEGVRVIDRDAPKPRLLGTYDTPDRAVRLAMQDHIVLVADVLGGLHLIDASQPHQPALIKSLPKLGQIVDVYVDAGFAYLANRRGQARLLVVDVRQPEQARVVGTYRNGSLIDVVVSGPMAYALDAFGSLQVLDMSVPERPVLLGAERIHGVAQSLAWSGSQTLVVAGDAGVQLVNVADPTRPTTVSQLPLDGESADVVTWGRYAYVAAGAAGIIVLDLAQPEAPRQLGVVPPLSDDEDAKIVRLAVSGSVLYASTATPELAIFSLASPPSPRLLRRVSNPPGTLWALLPHGHLLYATTILKQLMMWDVMHPDQPRQLGAAAGGARDLALIPPYLLQATESYKRRGGGLRVLDIYASLAPRVQSTGVVEAFDIAAAGPHLYVAAGKNGLLVGQTTAAGAFERIGHLPWQDTAQHLAVCGPRAYIGGGQTVASVDITTPSTPALHATLELDAPITDLTCLDDLLVVAGTTHLHLIDTAYDPPRRHTVAPSPNGKRRMAWWGRHYLLRADESGQLNLLDLSTPSAPRLAWRVDAAAPVRDLALYGNHIYAAVEPSGIVHLPMQRTSAGPPQRVWDGEVRSLAVWGRQAYVLDTAKGLVRLDLSDPDTPKPIDTVSLADGPTANRHLHSTPTRLYLTQESHGLRHLPIASSRTEMRVPQALVQSRKVDTATLPIASAMLQTHAWTGAFGHITYALSNNGGMSWEPVRPGRLHQFTTSGADLRWRAELHGFTTWADPALYAVQITYELATPAAQ
jgi:hypothetical protein